MVIIEQKMLREKLGIDVMAEKLGIDVMAQLKASVLKVHGRQDDAGMELTACAVGEPNAGVVLRAAMAVTAFGPGSDAPGDVDNNVTLVLSFERPMTFQGSKVEMRGSCERVGDGGRQRCRPWGCRNVPRCCAVSLFARNLACSVGRFWATHLHEPMTVWFQPGSRAVRAKPQPERDRLL